jgi:hypothetical protein
VIASSSDLLNTLITAECGGQYLVPLTAFYGNKHLQVKLDILMDNTPIDLFDDRTNLAFKVAENLASASYIDQNIYQSCLSLWASHDYLKRFGFPKLLKI